MMLLRHASHTLLTLMPPRLLTFALPPLLRDVFLRYAMIRHDTYADFFAITPGY